MHGQKIVQNSHSEGANLILRLHCVSVSVNSVLLSKGHFTNVVLTRHAVIQNSQDARKAKLYGKIGKLIVQAVKAGGSDAVANTRLKEILRQAQQAAVPKDIVERNIKNALDKNQADFQEVLYLTTLLFTQPARMACCTSAAPMLRRAIQQFTEGIILHNQQPSSLRDSIVITCDDDCAALLSCIAVLDCNCEMNSATTKSRTVCSGRSRMRHMVQGALALSLNASQTTSTGQHLRYGLQLLEQEAKWRIQAVCCSTSSAWARYLWAQA